MKFEVATLKCSISFYFKTLALAFVISKAIKFEVAFA